PNNYRAWKAIGFIRESNGDRENAIIAYQQSIAANPNQNDLRNKLITMGITPSNTNTTNNTLPQNTSGSIGYNPNENLIR
ncbi:MAG: hypothetical protein LBH59_07170, partial [Planctomycetaceae bacterium]|nr:hypothetical protein [Planctomycetaceae bacterium]